MTAWYQTPRWTGRLFVEQELMRERFPGFFLNRQPDGQLFWLGWLTPGGGRGFLVSVWYPTQYPYAEPQIRVVEPALVERAPHVYADGRLCVHRQRWDPTTGTAVSEVALAAEWLARYLIWRDAGVQF